MDSWHSYPKVYNIGHPAIDELFSGPVIVEEKVDGSQFSFGKFGDDLLVRSRGRVFDVEAPDNMFSLGAGVVKKLRDDLHDGWTYRGEYLNKPKHNALAYDRTPAMNVMRERGELQSAPQDIGNLLREVQTDIEAECEEEIKGRLYAWARKSILRTATRGLPEWYKQQLLDGAFVTREGE